MQVPILNGVYTDGEPDYRTSYPRNLVPVPKENGISKGYLRPADGIETFGTGPGIDRGGIDWKGTCYRVMGGDLVSVDESGGYTLLGSVGNGGQVTFDYSFDRLGIAAGGHLYYWDGVALSQVTDPDIGTVLVARWVDGYWMTTDGEFLVVTDLADPMAVNPLKYGSSEVDPDPVVGLLKYRNEIYALNRYTIEVFENVGGNRFPFQRIDSAQIPRGAMGTHCTALFMDKIAFLGSGRNEPPAVWIGVNSAVTKISTAEIDAVLQGYTDEQLALVVVEARCDKSHEYLYVHLPDQTLVYDGVASIAFEQHVWFTLTSSIVGLGQYRARNLVWCYDAWLCGDPTSSALGRLVEGVSTHYGSTNGWDFNTTIIYNESRGAQFHELELVCLPGRVPLGADPVIWTSFSLDGETWSLEKSCPAGKQGQRNKRLTWLKQGDMQNWRIQRFRGTSDAHLSIARLEVQIEALNA